MNDITVRISTGREEAAISGGLPVPLPLEQIETGMATVPGKASIAMPPVPSAAFEAIEGLPVPADQLSAAATSGARLPVPSQQLPEMKAAAPVPMSIEELDALAAAPPPKEGAQPGGRGRKATK